MCHTATPPAAPIRGVTRGHVTGHADQTAACVGV